MFKKILIANRGEIACRVATTARRLGVRTVAVYADADAGARHVAACDEAVHIGASAPADSYLRWSRIIEVALASGAEAVHPGYGFLSENQDFARACRDAGLVFIGPQPEAIEAMGLKAAAKQLMGRAGVPLVPGYHGADQDPALLQREADGIGYPVLIKASAGGGGKGMRVVEQAADFAAALASCQREARNSFGDDAVLLEKYVQRPRHVEVQVFGDRQGQIVYLFERDCSVQRRHQKVLEEAPAPGLDAAMRLAMGEAAVAAARAVHYEGAGTVEFIVEQRADGRRDFYFMEMNTRLQVEHPVTEAVTGLDLVEWQLRVASGEPLPLRQDQLTCRGHAIEARLCAESPQRQFLPATGQLQVFGLPPHVAFVRSAELPRIDAGVRQGDAITPFYDSMIGKLIVQGDTREQALARLDAALAQLRIVGVSNNVQFLRRVLASRSFAQADLDTALIEREQAWLFAADAGLPPQQAAVAVVAAQLLVEQRRSQQAQATGAGPFAASDGWQLQGCRQRAWTLLSPAGDTLNASLSYRHDGSLSLRLAQRSATANSAAADSADAPAPDLPLSVMAVEGEPDAVLLQHGAQRLQAWVYAQGGQFHVFSRDGAAQLQAHDPLAQDDEGADGGGQLTAPMPGKVVAFHVAAGDRVARGQALAVLEAMKMEHTIHAPADGVVGELLFAPGDQVAEGVALLSLQSS